MRETDYENILKSPLFNGMELDELKDTLNELKAHQRRYLSGQCIFAQGEFTENFGVIIDGHVSITKLDYLGKRQIIANLNSPDIFGEVYAFMKKRLEVNAVAESDCSILSINSISLLSSGIQKSVTSEKIVRNLLFILAEKNLRLSSSIEYLSYHTNRDKLLAFLSDTAQLKNSADFTLDMSKAALADFLAMNRSNLYTLIRELEEEGIIENSGRHFILKLTRSE